MTVEQKPRFFLGGAFLTEVESRTFIVFRSFISQLGDDRGTREKIRDIPITPPLREVEGPDEPVIFRTFHPVDRRPMSLTWVDQKFRDDVFRRSMIQGSLDGPVN